MKKSNQYFLHKEANGFSRRGLRSSVVPFVIGAIYFLSLALSALQVNAAPSDQSPPQRIISLSPGITEILFAIGAGDQVVGVTDFCNYPEKAKSLPRIGGLLNPSYETMITLQPDLIIHQPNKHKIENFVEQLDIRNLPISMLSFAEIYSSIKEIGIATHREKAADELIRSMQEKIDSHRKRLADVSQKSVLLVLGISNDSMRELYGVGPKTFLGEMLALAGGNNILAETQGQYPKVSKEFIIHESPEIIIEIGRKDILTEESSKKRRQGWQKFSTIRAVKNKNIHIIGADYILIPGPRLVNIVELFVKAIHPQIASDNPYLAEKTEPSRQ
ncbi:MAG: ABC transporter substrate-binding protein [Nitrospinaceae bacterium]|nr:MAG: ABC transporter substrate-binding protein [Nitrospinaceae bacterium]